MVSPARHRCDQVCHEQHRRTRCRGREAVVEDRLYLLHLLRL